MRWSMSSCQCTNWNTAQWTCDCRANKSQQRPKPCSSTPTECSMLCQDRKVLVWSMADKRSAVEAVSLRESLTRSRTRLRWLHLDVNVSEGLSAVMLIRDFFLRRQAWKVVFFFFLISRGQSQKLTGATGHPPAIAPSGAPQSQLT